MQLYASPPHRSKLRTTAIGYLRATSAVLHHCAFSMSIGKNILIHHAESVAALNLPPLDIIFGKTAAMQAVRNKLERVAETDVPVLIQG